MSLHRLAQQRAGKPVRVGLIGAGKFGSMFLNQIPTMPNVEIAVIADLDPERARVGLSHDRLGCGTDRGGPGSSRPARRPVPIRKFRSS